MSRGLALAANRSAHHGDDAPSWARRPIDEARQSRARMPEPGRAMPRRPHSATPSQRVYSPERAGRGTRAGLLSEQRRRREAGAAEANAIRGTSGRRCASDHPAARAARYVRWSSAASSPETSASSRNAAASAAGDVPDRATPNPAVALSKRSHNSEGPGRVIPGVSSGANANSPSIVRDRQPKPPSAASSNASACSAAAAESAPKRIANPASGGASACASSADSQLCPADIIRSTIFATSTAIGRPIRISDQRREQIACLLSRAGAPAAGRCRLGAGLLAKHPIDLALSDAPKPRTGTVSLQLAFLDPLAHRRLRHAQQLRDVRNAEQPILRVRHHLPCRYRLTTSNHCYPTLLVGDVVNYR